MLKHQFTKLKILNFDNRYWNLIDGLILLSLCRVAAPVPDNLSITARVGLQSLGVYIYIVV